MKNQFPKFSFFLLSVALVLVALGLLGSSRSRRGGGSRGGSRARGGTGGGGHGGCLDGGGLAHDADAEHLVVARDGVQLGGGAVDLVGGDGGGQVDLVLLDLGLDPLEGLGGGDVGGHVGLGGGIGLLDGEAATEGTGEGVVTASDGADVSGRG